MAAALLLCLLLTGIPADGAFAAERPKVSSFQDFYKEFSKQIHERRSLCYYDVSDDNLAKELVYQELTDYAKHYDPDDPLMSGCYLVYYIKTVYFTYDAHGLKVLIEFPYNGGDMDAHFVEMDRLALQLKKETDYDTVKNVHDYLIDNFEYDTNTEMANHTDIDGFRDKKMVCSGYSLATYYLLNKLGIETRIITGFGGDTGEQSENHMWNLVRLDGKWYNLDVTWDDGGGTNRQYTYVLKSDADFPMHVRMGPYAASSVAEQISKESWPVPFWTRFESFFRKRWYVFAIILGIIIYMIIVFKNRLRPPVQQNDDYGRFYPGTYAPGQNMNGKSGPQGPYGNMDNINPYAESWYRPSSESGIYRVPQQDEPDDNMKTD